MPVAGPSLLSPALAFNPAATATGPPGAPSPTLEPAVVGLDHAVRHYRFLGGAPSAAIPTGLATALPPVAVFNSAAGTLELVTVGSDGAVRHSRFQGDAWSAPARLDATTAVTPAPAVDSTGGPELAVVGPDHQVSDAHFDGTCWGAFEPTGDRLSYSATRSFVARAEQIRRRGAGPSGRDRGDRAPRW